MGHDSVSEVTWTQIAGLCGTGTVEMKPRCGLPTRQASLLGPHLELSDSVQREATPSRGDQTVNTGPQTFID